MDLNKEIHRHGFTILACQVCDPVPVYMLDPSRCRLAGYVYPYQEARKNAEKRKRNAIYSDDMSKIIDMLLSVDGLKETIKRSMTGVG